MTIFDIIVLGENMDKIKKYMKENYLVVILIIFSIVLHVITTIHLGINYNINSDDISYFNSGVVFKNEHIISMHNEYPSAQIMPGMTYMIGFISMIVGEGNSLWLALKIVWAIFGILSIIGIYKIVMLLLEKSNHKKICAFIASFPLLLPSYLWMDNLILTETPFLCGFIFLLYFTLKEAKVHSKINFLMITFLYLFCTLLKANFAIYPIIMVGYLIYKKYDYKLLFKEVLLAAGISLLFFIPWTIRNYKLFDEFIPLTYGGGNPLLLGTYQGYGYPSDEEIKTDEKIRENLSDELILYLEGNAEPEKTKYYALQMDGVRAKYRMNEWWKRDKLSMIISYTVLKPKELLGVFYWDEIFGIKNITLQVIRLIKLILFALLFLIIVIKRRLTSDIVFLGANVIIQAMVYSYTFTFTRYGQTLIFVAMIVIGCGIDVLINMTEDKKRKKSVKHNTPKIVIHVN